MTENEAEDIFMAWQVGANYPEEKLAEAVLILKARDSDAAQKEDWPL